VVLPCSNRISRVPSYSSLHTIFTHTGLSPSMACLPRHFRFNHTQHRPGPRSLAATSRVSVDVLSSGYLDVSVPRVRFVHLCIQCTIPLKAVGFPIRKFTDQSLFAAPHDISQRITSFIASCRQGIHQMLFLHFITLIFSTHPRDGQTRLDIGLARMSTLT
jgi:hypothetical protein